MIFQNDYPKSYLKQVKRNLPRSYRLGHVAFKGSVGIDVPGKKIYSGIFPETELKEIRSTLKQIGENKDQRKELPTVRRGIWEAIKSKVFQQFVDFWNSWIGMASNPSLAAKQLADDKITAIEPIKFYFLSFAMATILEKLLGVKSFSLSKDLLKIESLPVVGEVLDYVFFLLVALVIAAINHLILKMGKGKGKYRHAFFANLYSLGDKCHDIVH